MVMCPDKTKGALEFEEKDFESFRNFGYMPFLLVLRMSDKSTRSTMINSTVFGLGVTRGP